MQTEIIHWQVGKSAVQMEHMHLLLVDLSRQVEAEVSHRENMYMLVRVILLQLEDM